MVFLFVVFVSLRILYFFWYILLFKVKILDLDFPSFQVISLFPVEYLFQDLQILVDYSLHEVSIYIYVRMYLSCLFSLGCRMAGGDSVSALWWCWLTTRESTPVSIHVIGFHDCVLACSFWLSIFSSCKATASGHSPGLPTWNVKHKEWI